jgi:hypothetical protein
VPKNFIQFLRRVGVGFKFGAEWLMLNKRRQFGLGNAVLVGGLGVRGIFGPVKLFYFGHPKLKALAFPLSCYSAMHLLNVFAFHFYLGLVEGRQKRLYVYIKI